MKRPGRGALADPIMHGGRSRGKGLLIALAAFLLFSGTLGHDFVWDDEGIIHSTRGLVEEKGVASLLTAPFVAGKDESPEDSGYYRPVSLISMWVNDPVGQPSPFPYHLVNILLHAINVFLVFALFRMVLPDGPGALIGSAIFAVHPVHAESVAFISGRTDLLAAFFILATVLLWRQSRQAAGFPRATAYCLGLASFVLACLSKEIAFMVPVVVAVWAGVDGPRTGRESRWKISADMAWVTGWFITLALLVWFRESVLGIPMGSGWSSQALWADASTLGIAGDVAANIVVYLRLLVFPWPLKVYYPPVPPDLTLVNLVICAGFLTLCFILSGKRHHRVGILALSWVLLFLVPVSGVVGLGLAVIAERFCYLPSIGLALAAGYALGLVFQKTSSKSVPSVLIAGLLLLFGTGAVFHAARWSDEVVFFRHAVKSGPVPVPNMHFNLGNAYVKTGDLRSGIRAFEEAVRLNPLYVGAMLNESSAYIKLGEHKRALEILSRAGEIDPKDGRVWSNKGVVLELLGRTDEALEAYRRASELDPDEAAASFHRGNLLQRLGRYEESAGSFRGALAAEPAHLGALMGLGRSIENCGRFAEAQGMFLRAAELHPLDPEPYKGLGRVLLERGKPAQAIIVYRKALDLGGEEAGLHRGLVLAYYQAGRMRDAREHIRNLQSTEPGLSRQLGDLVDGLGGEEIDDRDPP